MKALILACVVAVAAGATTTAATVTNSCPIPSKFVTSTGTPGQASCTGADGYLVTGRCSALASTPVALNTSAKSFVSPLASEFTGAEAPTVAGCRFASQTLSFGTKVLGATTGNECPASTTGAFTTNGNELKTYTVVCDTAIGYFPTTGREGSFQCRAPVFASTGVNSVTTAAFLLPLDGTDTLVCTRGCTLTGTDAASLCPNGKRAPVNPLNTALPAYFALNPDVFTSAQSCTLRPNTQVFLEPEYVPLTQTVGTQPFGYSCGVDGVAIPFGTFPKLNLPTTGAFNAAPVVRGATPGTLSAGFLSFWRSVSATLTSASTSSGAVFDGRFRANDAVTSPIAGVSQTVTVTGCPVDQQVAGVTLTNRACVQSAINAWRCRGFIVDSATVCVADGIRIACPSPASGWTCPSSDSKKGLLGLLGLLGLIPLCCCLLLCLLFPCCLRRRKTEADVHFATFDPHAAPVAASVVAPTAFADPYGAAVVPSAVSYGAPAVFGAGTPVF